MLLVASPNTIFLSCEMWLLLEVLIAVKQEQLQNPGSQALHRLMTPEAERSVDGVELASLFPQRSESFPWAKAADREQGKYVKWSVSY